MTQRKRINFNISTLADGEVAARVEMEVEKIAQNILDMNTKAEAKRRLIIDVEFIPNKQREMASIEVSVSSKLAKQETTGSVVMLGRDYNTGFVELNELQSGNPGQMYIDPEDSKLKTDVGQEVDEIEHGIIDFNKKRKA